MFDKGYLQGRKTETATISCAAGVKSERCFFLQEKSRESERDRRVTRREKNEVEAANGRKENYAKFPFLWFVLLVYLFS